MEQLAAIAFQDVGEIVEWGPDFVRVRPSEELTPLQRASVSEVTTRRTRNGTVTTVKLRDPMPALALLAKHVGGFEKGDAEKGPDIVFFDSELSLRIDPPSDPPTVVDVS